MSRLKRLLPFIFPTAAIVLVIILGVRWFRLRQERTGQISEFAEGIEIEDLTDDITQEPLSEAEDLESQELMNETDDESVMGQVRYELDDERIHFSVFANLPETDATYQVWLQDLTGESRRPAFVLSRLKGGYIGSAAISVETLPFEVIVSKEAVLDNQPEQIMLRGIISASQETLELDLE
jgi:hypothetical protein